MFVDSAKNTMNILASEDGIDSDGTHYLINMRRDSTKFFTDNADAQPTNENMKDAAAFISEITELQVSSEQTKQILKLYPHVRIKLAIYNGISDTDVRDGLSGAAAHYILGCEWPTFGDDLDVCLFVEALKREAIHHGFTPLEHLKS